MTRRSVAAFLAGAVVFGAAFFGCNQRTEKGPPLTCEGRCAPTTPGTVGTVTPPPDAGGEGGASGTDQSPVRLEGEVRILNDISALTGAPLLDPADILVEGVPLGVLGRWNGGDTFSIDGVKRSHAVWAQVTPVTGDALRTLQPIDTDLPNSPDVVSTVLTVVRESEIDIAYNVLATPVVRDISKAQAILVVLKDGKPAAGVRVLAPGSEAVIYAANGSFSDAVASTDPSGIVLLANVPAVPWPGSTISVTLTGMVTTQSDVKLVERGVTFAGVGN